MALAFRRADVAAFLDEIDHEQFEEWCAFFRLEPQGWQATNLAITRLSYLLAQTHTKKKLRERDYEIRLSGGGHSPQMERVRWEAMTIRQEIAAGRRGE